MCVCLYVLCSPGRDGAGAGGGNKVGAGGGEGGMARGRGEMGGGSVTCNPDGGYP